MTNAPALYRLYGVVLSSTWPIAAPPGSGEPDIELAAANASRFPKPAPASDRWFDQQLRDDGSIHLHWRGLFEFLVDRHGRKVLGRALAGSGEKAFRTYLLGQVLSYALVRHGMEPLHAAALALNGHAVGLLGDCGAGKSTLAAGLIARGYRLLTDDLLNLSSPSAAWIAYPGPPRLKLFPSVAGSVLPRLGPGVPMNPLTPKSVFALPLHSTESRPVPLRALCVLGSAPAGRIGLERISPYEAFVELTRHTFNTRIDDPARLRRQFAFASRLASSIAVYRLSYTRDLALLPQVCDRIAGLLLEPQA